VVEFVGRTTIEWKRVVGILWALFMEHIVLAIVPVGERSVIGACLLDRLRGSHDLDVLGGCRFALLAPKLLLVSGLEVHGVRVDDLCLFLHVESLFVIFDVCLLQLVGVILAIVGK